MAMNKRERDTLEAALRQAALRHTGPVECDVPVPSSGQRTTGYVVVGSGLQATVREATSETNRHWLGTHNPSGYGSQSGIAMYSTRAMAIRQARYLCEQAAASRLRELDCHLADEEATSE